LEAQELTLLLWWWWASNKDGLVLIIILTRLYRNDTGAPRTGLERKGKKKGEEKGFAVRALNSLALASAVSDSHYINYRTGQIL
jgi:hypothetical protein